MEQGILLTTKKLLGVDPDDDSFDLDIITHINSAFSNLSDLGLGPANGFVIDEADAEWETYFDSAPEDPNDPENKMRLSTLKSFVFLRAKLAFDPPTSSFLLESTQSQLREQEWRLSVNREAYAWVDPAPPVLVLDEESA